MIQKIKTIGLVIIRLIVFKFIVFTSQQHQAGLNYLLGKMELKDIQDHRLQRVLKPDGTRQLFIGECGQDPELDHKQIEMVQARLKQQTTRFDQYKQDQIKDYQAINYYPTTLVI